MCKVPCVPLREESLEVGPDLLDTQAHPHTHVNPCNSPSFQLHFLPKFCCATLCTAPVAAVADDRRRCVRELNNGARTGPAVGGGAAAASAHAAHDVIDVAAPGDDAALRNAVRVLGGLRRGRRLHAERALHHLARAALLHDVGPAGGQVGRGEHLDHVVGDRLRRHRLTHRQLNNGARTGPAVLSGRPDRRPLRGTVRILVLLHWGRRRLPRLNDRSLGRAVTILNS